jgi:hypothetical protein
MIGYVCVFGCVILAGLLGVACGILAGWLSDSTLVASLTSVLLYSLLLFAGCWWLYHSIGPMPQGMPPHVAELNARVQAQTEQQVIRFGVFCFLLGGGVCAMVPMLQRRLSRRPM